MWWIDVIIVAVVALGVYGFVTLTRSQTAWFSRKSDRTAEDLYPDYADPSPHNGEHKRATRDRSDPPDPRP